MPESEPFFRADIRLESENQPKSKNDHHGSQRRNGKHVLGAIDARGNDRDSFSKPSTGPALPDMLLQWENIVLSVPIKGPKGEKSQKVILNNVSGSVASGTALGTGIKNSSMILILPPLFGP
jgi:hypothetical protein